MLLVALSPWPAAAKQADEVFKDYGSALVQIKSINIESGQKSSIGTGFFINDTGRIVTNYHVISGFVQTPDKYRLEYIDQKEQNFPVTVLAVDVINDLALLKAEREPKKYFDLAKDVPLKGEKLFALGNPHDLGMIVVPGTYNGIKQNSFYQRIHFTGSINPGMSGGPTVNDKGSVIGINVATAGNQIGFLVPVDKLWTMIDKFEADQQQDHSLQTSIGQQLKDNQSLLYQQLIDADWQLGNLGNASVPRKVADFMQCWGDSNKNKDKVLFTQASTNCAIQDNVFLSGSFRTGKAQLGFSWIKSDKLNEMQLSQLYERNLNQDYGRNNAAADEVSNYHCSQAWVENQSSSLLKGVTCVRAYRKYPGLFDVKFKSLLMGKEAQALVARYMLQGVTQDTANAFYQKFVEQVSWK